MNRNDIFLTYNLSENGIKKLNQIRDEFDCFLNDLMNLLPEKTREVSIVLTKLEEACIFAKKAVAKSPENHK